MWPMLSVTRMTWLTEREVTDQVSVQDPVGMEVVDSIQDLEQQGLHHALGHLHSRLLASFDCTVILDDVLGKEK